MPPPTASRTPHPAARHPVALEILLHGPLSRSELARRLDLSPASLTRLTRPLLESGLIIESPDHQDTPRSGRPTRPLDLVPTAHHFVGGLTTDQRGVVRAPFLEWAEPVPLAPLLEQATGLPTVVENDVLALTRAEHWFGAARGWSHFAVVTIGAGVGCGLVVHDAIVESPDAGLGLVGHHPLDPLGPVCFAGHRGCATAVLTIPSIQARVSVALRRSVSYDECLDLAAEGNAAAALVAAESGRALGRLIAAVANFTMARKIILTGEGIRLAVVAHDAVAEGIRLDRDPLANPLEIDIQHTGFDEWARGAAATAIQAHILDNRAAAVGR